MNSYDYLVQSLKAKFFDLIVKEGAESKDLDARIMSVLDTNEKDNLVKLKAAKSEALSVCVDALEELCSSIINLEKYSLEYEQNYNFQYSDAPQLKEESEVSQEEAAMEMPNDTLADTAIGVDDNDLSQEEVPMDMPEAALTDTTVDVDDIDLSQEEVPMEMSEATSMDTTVGVDDTNNQNLDIQLPIINAMQSENAILDSNLGESSTKQEDTVSQTFIKANPLDVARAILTTKNQSTRLKQSLLTQEALLNARGSYASRSLTALSDGNITEQQLIQSGLLEPTIEDKKRKLEELVEEGNKLYREGKANEAAAIFDQVSILNKEIQEANNTVSK